VDFSSCKYFWSNKRTLQKLENVTDDLEKAQQELKELKEKQNEKNNTKDKRSLE
jgi:hypothetical protein